MKRFGWTVWILLALVFALGTAWADTPYDVEGSAGAALTFYVESQGSASVTLTQSSGTYARTNTSVAASGYSSYHVDCTVNGASTRVDWTAGSATLSLPVTGLYTIRVTPFTAQEMQARYTGFSRWMSMPTWSVTGANRATVSLGGTQTLTPAYQKMVTVEYRDTYGALLQSTQTACSVGSNQVTAPYTLENGAFRRISAASQTVTLSGDGVLSTATVTFFYTPVQTAAATPQPLAVCAVYYRDVYGALIQQRNVTCQVGNNTITAPTSLTGGYVLSTPAQQTVTLSAQGQLSTSSVTFYYTLRHEPVVTATPKVRATAITATIQIFYRDNAGNLIQQRSVTVTPGTNIITAPDTLQGGAYIRTSANRQTVTLSSSGQLSAGSVTFYYNPKQKVTANVTIRQIDVDSLQVLASWTQTLEVGTHTIYAGTTPYGYRAYSETYATVNVRSDGIVSPSSVIYFEYKRNASYPTATPKPVVPTAQPEPAYGQVYPLWYDTQFKEGSKNPRAINTLPNAFDGNYNTSFYYTYWLSERSDDIPEISVGFDGQDTISRIGITPGSNRSYDSYVDKAKPRIIRAVIYSDEGVHEVSISLKNGYQRGIQVFSLGASFHHVTQIDLFITNIYSGQANQNEVNVAEIKFYQ